MSSVNITNVQVLDNPAKWPAPLQFEITFECLTPLQEGASNPNKFIIAAILMAALCLRCAQTSSGR